jgi:DNA-binding protein HU-beta
VRGIHVEAIFLGCRGTCKLLVSRYAVGQIRIFLRNSSIFLLKHFGFVSLDTPTMAKALTKSQIAASIADSVGITKKQAVQTVEALVQLAYKNAKNSFTLPGLGKLVLVNRKARMGRNPATGQEIKIPAKRVVKFRVAKAAKDAILGAK